MAGRNGLDAVSFVFAQVLTQIDYLYESGHLSQANYATIATALLQASPPGTPAAAPLNPAPFATSVDHPLTAEPSQYASPSSASMPSAPPAPLIPSKSSRSTPLLKLKSKISSSGKQGGSLPPTPTAGMQVSPNKQKGPAETQDDQDDEEEEQLGRVNKNLRRALANGFLLGSVVDQALAITPFFPEAMRERIVEKVEEGSEDLVRKWTSPRQQAIVKQKVARAGSSAITIARGGGGTSRASSSANTSKATSGTTAAAEVGTETGQFTLIQSVPGQGPGDAALSITSVHSFAATEDLQITTVVTASYLKEDPSEAAIGRAREVGLAPEQITSHELPSWTSEALPSLPGDGSAKVTGRDW